ncbi:MAG: DUF1957 domain-containing protein [Nitrospirae bacterium]|nr:DUF1957 domain-containing protein [Nitrospirota bacterium]
MQETRTGSFTFVLHAHLPYVLSHGRWPHGADWLNEAAAETYIPLLDIFNKLVGEGISPRVTMGITPVLTEQLRDPYFVYEFKGYLMRKRDAARADIKAFKAEKSRGMLKVARMWEAFYDGTYKAFTKKYGEDIVGGFAALQDEGHIEIITCGATHGYFPLLSRDESVRAQVRQAVASYRRNYGLSPRGIWLPECAYRPGYSWTPPVGDACEPYERTGVEYILAENGIEYFIVDSHMLEGGKPVGVYLDKFAALGGLWGRFSENYSPRPSEPGRSPYEIYQAGTACGDGGGNPVAVLARDPRTGVQVWSGEHGYPGNGYYLDFHKKRDPGGLRYWRVTDPKLGLGDKEEYQPDEVDGYMYEQAAHFRGLVKDVLARHREKSGSPGLLTAPFDAELFGHWWFEGPRWLYEALKALAHDPDIELTTASGYLDKNSDRNEVSLPEGSWGEGGFHYIWLNEETVWTWRRIYEAEAEMVSLADDFGHEPDGLLRDILKQVARELLLMQSSDWQFLISTRSAADYASTRLARHHADFMRLSVMARRLAAGIRLLESDMEFLSEVMERDRLFDDIDPAWWAGGPAV